MLHSNAMTPYGPNQRKSQSKDSRSFRSDIPQLWWPWLGSRTCSNPGKWKHMFNPLVASVNPSASEMIAALACKSESRHFVTDSPCKVPVKDDPPVCVVFYERPPCQLPPIVCLCWRLAGLSCCPPRQDLGAGEGKSLGSRRVLNWVCVREVTHGWILPLKPVCFKGHV